MTQTRQVVACIKASLYELKADQRGVGFVEFALMLPIVLTFMLMGLEFANYLIANQKVQKLAFVAGDMVARSTTPPNEEQMADVLLSMDVAAEPLNLREDGRLILTGIVGLVDADTDAIENKLVWQRCDGNLTGFESHYGAEDNLTPQERTKVALPNNIRLDQAQMIVTTEVGFEYTPIINFFYYDQLGLERTLTARSTLRSRNKAFLTIVETPDFTPKLCS